MTDNDEVDTRTDELREQTSLSGREAEVQARKEHGYTHEQIADQLDIDKSTVDEYSRRIRNKREEAVKTIREVSVDQIKARCLSCGTDVDEGPVLADFPICETCFRIHWRQWFERDVRVNVSRDDVDRMLDKRIQFLNDVNVALIQQMADDLR